MDPSAPAVLAPSRRFRRWCAVWSVLALLALAVSVWSAVVAYSTVAVPVVGTEVFLAGYPLVLARSRLAVTAEEFQPRWPRSAAGQRVPWARVTGLTLCRGLLLDRVQVTAGGTRVLLAPARFRGRSDAVFDAAVTELARRSGCRVRLTRRRRRATAAVLWVAGLALLTAMDAPWNNPSWPWRHEAARLPDACAAFAGTARSLLPHSRMTPDPDLFLLGPIRRESGCTWRAGRTDTFSVGLGLTGRAVFRSASATAHRGLARTVAAARRPDRAARPLTGLGDEAREITDDGPATADVLVRRANVIVVVRVITTRSGVDAARTAERVARDALARVVFGRPAGKPVAARSGPPVGLAAPTSERRDR